MLHLTNKATKRPQKPSEWWGFDRITSQAECIDFDLAVEEFDDWLQERSSRTRPERIPEHDKNAPLTRQVPLYTTVAELLGYDKTQEEVTDESSLSADEAELLHQYETGEISEEDIARLGM